MLTGYARRYPEESFTVEPGGIESEFATEIRNPETGAESRTFTLAGKTDLLMRRDGGLWLGEHKTTAAIDGAYIERLWMDFQTTLYAWAVERVRGEPVAGVVYNVIAKAGLRPYEAGKKRKADETEDEFTARLAEWYANPDVFHREELLISPAREDVLRAELWELTQALLDARRRNVWYQNPSQCFQWNHACAYWPICRSCDNTNVIDNDYRHADAHAELAPVENGNRKTRTTYSMWSSFRDCRRRYYWRHERQIVPVAAPAESLFLGSVVHAALAEWHKSRDLAATLTVIDTESGKAPDQPLAF
jgi:hypothetical protein